MKKLVSIVVPIYNVENYLDRCLNSIINQTYKNIEIILVDDGSYDDCPKICDRYALQDNRIKVIHKKNAGLGMARNTGIENANGDYIFFFDSDDYVDLSAVEKCVTNAVLNNSDVVMFGRYDDYNGVIKHRSIKTEQFFFQGEEIQKKVLASLFTYDMGIGTSACMKMFNLQIIKENDFRFKSEKEIISEDSFFMLEFFRKVRTATIIPESLYYYFKRSESLTCSYKPNRQKKNDDFLKICLNYVKEVGLPSEISNHIQARYHGLTLGAMMQIIESDLSEKEKNNELNQIFHNDLLRDTLKNDVIQWDARVPQIFWYCLKLKLYFLCYILLYFNKIR